MDTEMNSHFKPKTKNIIMIVDNRPTQGLYDRSDKLSQNDFRCSLFKQTEVDPMESRWDLLRQEESIMEQLCKRVNGLEQRVRKLQRNEAVQTQSKKKYRRKAMQIARNHSCPFENCQRIYGSQTSLRNHIRVKHPNQTR